MVDESLKLAQASNEHIEGQRAHVKVALRWCAALPIPALGPSPYLTPKPMSGDGIFFPPRRDMITPGVRSCTWAMLHYYTRANLLVSIVAITHTQDKDTRLSMSMEDEVFRILPEVCILCWL